MKPTNTSRQFQILRLRAEGNTIKVIAQKLGISRKTVEWHWYELRRKLGIYDLALLTQYALKNRIAKWKV